MIDYQQYRARIGQYNVSGMKYRSKKYSSNNCSGTMHRKAAMLIFVVGFVCLTLFIGGVVLSRLDIPNSNFNYTGLDGDILDSGSKKLFFLHSAKEWNSIMKSLNGNTKNSLNVAHWNGGSSYLAKSSKGKEKMEHIKFLLNKYNIDVFGISEANLHNSVDEFEYKINNYKAFHQDHNISRIITYVKDDLDCKLEADLMDPELACI